MRGVWRDGRRRPWRGLMAAWLLALIIGLAGGPAGHASVELKEFTATARADGTILVRWVTGIEIDSIGFRVYRALTATGPWVTVVHEEDARSDGEADTVYEFVDTEVFAGITYYYLLEEIEYDGENDTIRPIRYIGQVSQATVGPGGKTPAPATATPTATATATLPATALPTATPTRTPTVVPSVGAGTTSTATATARPTVTPLPPAGTTPSPSDTP
ncbi:MAG: hypothetical protein ACP5UQ_10325, partial [Anaerolineae bacterium]